MKSNPHKLAAILLATAIPAPVFAIDAPQDDAPPPPAAQRGDDALPHIKLPPASKPVAAPTAFLGVISSELPEVLSQHLKLEEGQGILVRSLVPDGPAAKAGLQVNDIIVKVGDTTVGSPADISRQVSAKKPGDTVKLEFIHKGTPTTAEVILGTKPAILAAGEMQPLQQLDMDGLPHDLAQRVRDAIAGNIGGMDLQRGQVQGQIPPNMEDALRELQNRVENLNNFSAPGIPGAQAGGRTQVHGESTVRMKDGNGSLEVKSKDGSKQVTIRDVDDNVTWSGPWNSAEDKAAAPPEVRSRVESLNLDTDFKGNGLRLQMRQGNVLPAAPEPPEDGKTE